MLRTLKYECGLLKHSEIDVGLGWEALELTIKVTTAGCCLTIVPIQTLGMCVLEKVVLSSLIVTTQGWC